MATEKNIPAGYLPEGGLLVKYELAWTPGDGTATIVRSVYAGVSGPDGTVEGVTSREAAEAYAFERGLILAGQWHVTGGGSHWAPLTSMKG